MAFSVEGLTFGDFSCLTAEEYTELFGTGGKHLQGSYLELPWDEEENLQSVLRPIRQAQSVTYRCVPQQQGQELPVQQPLQQTDKPPQYQPTSQHLQQQISLQHQRQQQQQQLRQQEQQPQQQHQVPQQQHQAPQQQHQAPQQQHQAPQQQHQAPQQQHQAPQQHPQQQFQQLPHQCPQQQVSQPPQPQQQVQLQASQHPQQQPQSASPQAMYCPPMAQQPVVSPGQQYSNEKQTVPVHVVTTHPTAATNNMNATHANNASQQVLDYMQPSAVPAALQAEAFAEKEEGAQSSDGGNGDGDMSGDGKRRRNKKRRDPNYYKTFYENPALYGSTETAYYADNESSSGSSGNTSEAHSIAQDAMSETIVDIKPMGHNEHIARGQIEPINFNQPSDITLPVVLDAHMQQVNRTVEISHEGYIVHPTDTNVNVKDGAPGLKQTVRAISTTGRQSKPVQIAPPPGLQHPTAAAHLQKLQFSHHAMPAITNVQDLSFQYRTTECDEGQTLSLGDKPSPSAVVPKKSDIACNSSPGSNTLNSASSQSAARVTTPLACTDQHTPHINLSATPVSVSPMPPNLKPVVPAVDACILLPTSAVDNLSSLPNSSSASATPGSSTSIVSPTSTPVASPLLASPSAAVALNSAETSPAAQAPVIASAATFAPSPEAALAAAPAAASVAACAVTSVATPAAAPAAAPPVKPTSWAGLFKSPSAASTPMIITTACGNSTVEDKAGEQQNNTKSHVSPNDDPRAKELADILSHYTMTNRNAFLRPRGLNNTGNWCYINSILQALVACPPLTNLVRALPYRSIKQQDQEATSTPMLNALIHFFHIFQPVPLKIREKAREIRPGVSFEPTMIYHMLSAVNISLSVKQGRQEDAEEFLSCLLNGLHEEMLAVLGIADDKKSSANGPAGGHVDINNKHSEGNHVNETNHGDDAEDDEDEWEQVGPKNKSSITRGAHFTQTPLSKIFGGQMRSALHQQGSRESATLQPFFTLQLDIQDEKIWSVRDALDSLGLKESLQGFTCNKTKMEVEASRRITLEELPPVLILHLKCFVYDKTGGCQKLIKKLDYNMDLDISKDLLSPSLKMRASVVQRSYRLLAVVYHVGKEASGGHYITDVFHAGLNTWMRMDDSNVRFIKAHQVVKPQSSLTPYLLFYRRNDCAHAQS